MLGDEGHQIDVALAHLGRVDGLTAEHIGRDDADCALSAQQSQQTRTAVLRIRADEQLGVVELDAEDLGRSARVDADEAYVGDV